jgi:hypothetical protein
MRKIDNFENVTENQGGEFEKLPAGGYVCMIKSVVNVPEKEYLKIEFDIIDGQYRGWYTNIFKRTGDWYGNFVRSYKESALGFFKGFITAIEQSNPGYKWGWDEQTLVKKKIGLVLAYEEYLNKRNELKERIYVAQNRSIDAIRSGDFIVPEVKKPNPANSAQRGQQRSGDYNNPADAGETFEDCPF